MAPSPHEPLTDIRQALRDLRTPTRLNQSSWLSACLVARRLREEPGLAPYEALREAFAEILKQVEADKPDYADLLRGRFWEGLTVDRMITDERPRQMSSSNFYNLQREALDHFAYLLLEKEQACQRSIQAAVEDITAHEVAEDERPPVQPQASAGEETQAALPLAPAERQPAIGKRSTRAGAARLLVIAGLIAAGLLVIGIASQRSLSQGYPRAQGSPASAGAPSSISAAGQAAGDPPSRATTISPPSPPTTAGATTSAARPSPTPAATVCGEASRVTAPNKPRFLRHQGVSAFTVDNTDGAVLLDRVRAITIDPRGLWIGYFSTDPAKPSGLGHYDKKTWASCNQPGGVAGTNINALAVDHAGRLWVGNEKAGVAMFDGTNWHTYTISDGLPSNEIFGLTVDDQNDVWAATWEGVAKFDGTAWTVPYTAYNNTIFSNHVHAIAFDSGGNIWVGHIHQGGLSQYRNADGTWVWHTPQTSGIGGDEVHSIVVRKGSGGEPESVWFGTAGGGVSRFEQGRWTTYRVEDGLPSNEVRGLAIDRYNRVWAATSRGVAYFDGTRWVVYDTLDTLSIAFGPSCPNCPIDDDHVWTGTATAGLTHSRIPLPDTVADVVEICFNSVDRQRVCPLLPTQQTTAALTPTDAITVTYPVILTPGQLFRPEIVLASRAPYQFREDRGDFLSNMAERDADLYGAYEHIAVRGISEPGQPYTFTDFDSLLKAPDLTAGAQEETFISTWRMWMHTRYVGPTIHLVFKVRRP